jgi:hypothetical protein
MTEVFEDGADGHFLRDARGNKLTHIAILQRVRQAVLQAEGKKESRHPNGWPELFMDDGTCGVHKVGNNPGIYFIHPRAIVLYEEWRKRSDTPGDEWYGTFPRRGPKPKDPEARAELRAKMERPKVTGRRYVKTVELTEATKELKRKKKAGKSNGED